MTHNDRPILRRMIRQKRAELPFISRLQTALELSHYIANTLWFRKSRRIAFYQAIQGELDPSHLMQTAFNLHKACYLPVCHPLHQQRLLFLPYFKGDSLRPNHYGILEPNKKRSPCQPFALDLVFVPLVAFDIQGNRLGSGKGYYDRTFAYLRRFPHPFRPLLVGLAYDFQEVETIPAERWDIPLDKIVVSKTP